ncbi:flagellar hook capping FlgD N-terminal domain-containing protein [Curvibacter sp. RS43]|uniref:flagellar hook assembly protein FlgD n=1 Tax=Curvibacter microcysteis TaxID=3026419 RepID=UPI002361B8D7|nr:flagellar hook capping FlgD N-terminal domain-containing protein [Curvibacter sp. RS43]MDD0811788.1 flagellar hook capping FlgD N-terminal domain-containing protein [Curvibacter sp. RS43]
MSSISVDASGNYSYNTNSSTASTGSSTSANGLEQSSPADQQDRFLKLLVAQMTHQDPMNPVDNAQMTSQIAQINTVTGIQQLNSTMQTMASQFSSMQLMQGGSLIGREVLTSGNTLGTSTDAAGKVTATGTFDLPSNAADVQVQISTASGQLLATVPMGTQSAGRHDVSWDASSYKGKEALKYTVVAKNGSSSVTPTTYSHDKVSSVGSNNGALAITLKNGGTVSYDKIVSVY